MKMHISTSAVDMWKRKKNYASLGALSAVLMLTAFAPVGYQYTIVNRPRLIVKEFVNDTLNERSGINLDSKSLDMFYSFLVACQGVGALFGAAIGPYLANHVGRKWTAMIVQGACQTLGSICLIIAMPARSFELIIIGRLVVGVSSGLTYAVVPMFLLECAPAAYRGVVGSIGWLAVLIGDAVARLVNFAATEETWGYCFGATVITGLIQMLTATIFHESPKYLLLIKEDYKAGLKSVEFYFSKQQASHRIAKIVKEEQTNTEPPVSIRRMLKHEVYRIPLLLSIVINAATAAGGLYALFSYSTVIFDGLWLDTDQSTKAQIMIPVNIVSGIVQVFLVTRVKSRPLILCSIGGVIIFNSIFFIAATIEKYHLDFKPATYTAAAALGLAVIAMNLGCAPLSLYLPAEVSVTAARPRTATAGALTKMLGFLITQLVFLVMYDEIDDYVFLIFIVLSTICLMILGKYLPETKGQPLDEITKNWRKHDNRAVQMTTFPFEAIAAIEAQRKISSVNPTNDIFGDWYQ